MNEKTYKNYFCSFLRNIFPAIYNYLFLKKKKKNFLL